MSWQKVALKTKISQNLTLGCKKHYYHFFILAPPLYSQLCHPRRSPQTGHHYPLSVAGILSQGWTLSRVCTSIREAVQLLGKQSLCPSKIRVWWRLYGHHCDVIKWLDEKRDLIENVLKVEFSLSLLWCHSGINLHRAEQEFSLILEFYFSKSQAH